MIDRQKLIGWIILLWSGGYLLYVLKARILVPGPVLERKEILYLLLSLGGIILGTINVRMASARARGEVFYKPDFLSSKPANENKKKKKT